MTRNINDCGWKLMFEVMFGKSALSLFGRNLCCDLNGLQVEVFQQQSDCLLPTSETTVSSVDSTVTSAPNLLSNTAFFSCKFCNPRQIRGQDHLLANPLQPAGEAATTALARHYHYSNWRRIRFHRLMLHVIIQISNLWLAKCHLSLLRR
jgi:hypothetical protein